MFGTCSNCGTTCTRVFLVQRSDEEGLCATCVSRLYPAARTQPVAECGDRQGTWGPGAYFEA